MDPTQRKLHEIEAETRYFTLDRLLLVPIVVAFSVLAMLPMASAITPILAGISQALQHVAALPH
jgi:hypothetical protein